MLVIEWFNFSREFSKADTYARGNLGRPHIPAVKPRCQETFLYERSASLAIVPAANRIHYSLAMSYRGLGELEKAKANLALQGTVGVRRPDPLIEELPELINFTSTFFRPDADPKLIAYFNEMQRASADPETAARYYQSCHLRGDGRDLFRQVRMPTLVVHCQEDITVSAEEGRLLASLIPGAQLVLLPSGTHYFPTDPEVVMKVVAAINRFSNGENALIIASSSHPSKRYRS